MKKIITLIFVVVSGVIAASQSKSTFTVKFLYNGKAIDINKDLVHFRTSDIIEIAFESKEPLNADEIRVVPYYAKPQNAGQQQVQQRQKIKLVTGRYKNLKGFTAQKKFIVKIPVSAFPPGDLSKL